MNMSAELWVAAALLGAGLFFLLLATIGQALAPRAYRWHKRWAKNRERRARFAAELAAERAVQGPALLPDSDRVLG